MFPKAPHQQRSGSRDAYRADTTGKRFMPRASLTPSGSASSYTTITEQTLLTQNLPLPSLGKYLVIQIGKRRTVFKKEPTLTANIQQIPIILMPKALKVIL